VLLDIRQGTLGTDFIRFFRVFGLIFADGAGDQPDRDADDQANWQDEDDAPDQDRSNYLQAVNQGLDGVAGDADRTKRGPLAPIDAKPAQEVLASSTGKHVFRMQRSDWKPGRYRVICRAKDATKLRGERFPWVLDDPEGLLESERAWWVELRANDAPGK